LSFDPTLGFHAFKPHQPTPICVTLRRPFRLTRSALPNGLSAVRGVAPVGTIGIVRPYKL
jgi:hypothetical protein